MFRYRCADCGEFDELATVSDIVRCPFCEKSAEKIFTPTVNVVIPAYMSAGSSGRYESFFASESTQAKLKSGEWEIDKSDE